VVIELLLLDLKMRSRTRFSRGLSWSLKDCVLIFALCNKNTKYLRVRDLEWRDRELNLVRFLISFLVRDIFK
jgi:hypothetical protein